LGLGSESGSVRVRLGSWIRVRLGSESGLGLGSESGLGLGSESGSGPSQSLPSKVVADTSGVAVGGVLLQQHEEIWHPVAYYSRKLSPTEQRYTTHERECLAIKPCLVEWRHYLLGAPFTVLSEHESLKWLQTQGVTTLSDCLLRWVEYFSLYDFQQEYIPGELNVFPDGLSRPTTAVCGPTRWPIDTMGLVDHGSASRIV
jgi:hypothetical protein